MAEGIGIRNIIHQSVTSSHGQVYIEDVNSEGQTMIRHMYCEIPESTEPYASAKLITSEYYLLMWHVKENPTIHHFGFPKHMRLIFFLLLLFYPNFFLTHASVGVGFFG